MARNATKNGLSPKQNAAIDALLAGMTRDDAAAAAGVSTSTVKRWANHEPVFIAELDRLTRAAIAAASRQLAGTLERAIQTFQEIMDDANASDSLRLRAADKVVAHSLKLLEITEIERRITALEEAMETGNHAQF